LNSPNKMTLEKAFVISLKDRPLRLKSFLDGLPKCDWLPEVEVWPAISGTMCPPPDNWKAGGGAWGCYRSHMQILEYCLNNRISSYIVFEDDAQFHDDFDQANIFLDNLPDHWQQAYLGGQLMHVNSHRPKRINEHVLRPYNVNRTHCFAVNRPGMIAIYQHCSHLPFEHSFHIDHHLGRFHEDARNAVYCPNKWYVGQHGFKSDISGKEEGVAFFTNPEKYASNEKIPNKCILYRANPAFRKDCVHFLHFGNNIGANGIDISIEAAAQMKNPARAFNYWWGFVSREAYESGRIPALYHPEVTLDELKECLPDVEWIAIDSAGSVEDIEEQAK